MQIGKFSIMNSQIIFQMIKIMLNPFVFLGFICYALASVVWIVTLSRVPLSFAYPMLSINYVGILIASKMLFGEDVNMVRWIGVFIICTGVFLVGRS